MGKLLSVLSSTLQGGVREGLLFLALLATTTLWAHDFEVDGVFYNIRNENNVEVTCKGSYSDSYEEYSGEVTIPETVTYNGTTYSVTSIGNSAFAYCSSLTSVTIPNSVTSIGDGAFQDCTSLTSVTIGNSVTSIGYRAFYGCTSLTSMVVESGNNTYDSRENCNAIIETATNTLIAGCQNTTIPNSVTSIGDRAFEGCKTLTSITIPNSVTSIGYDAFCDCKSLTSITIPEGVTSIRSGAFYGCSALTSVTIGNSVTSIEGYAFRGCYALTSITIPNSVTSIGERAFCDCSALTSITIGNSVTSIGGWAFEGCDSLKTVICEAIEVPGLLGGDVFYDMPLSEATLYVPAQSLDDYKTAWQWKEFGTILPIEETPTGVENTYNPSSTVDTNKLIRDGQLIIVRGGKSYSVTGQELY